MSTATGSAGEVAHELERDCDAAFHVARAETVYGAALDPAREVALCRDGVVVAGEHDERRTGARWRARGYIVARELGSNGTGTAARRCSRISASCRLSDGMSTSSSVRARVVGERGHRGESTAAA